MLVLYYSLRYSAPELTAVYSTLYTRLLMRRVRLRSTTIYIYLYTPEY